MDKFMKYGVVKHETKYRVRRWTVGSLTLLGSFAMVGVLTGNGDEIVDTTKSALHLVKETGENMTEQFQDVECEGAQQFTAIGGSTFYDFSQLVEHGPEVSSDEIIDKMIDMNRKSDDETDSDVISLYPGQVVYAPLECYKGNPDNN
jgi:hypothetical protein